MDLIQNVALMIENKYVKFDENSYNIMEAMYTSVFVHSMASKSLKGGNFIKINYRVMPCGQNVALVMVNNFVKFDENSLHFVKVVAEIC